MSLNSSTKIATNRYELEVSVDAEKFEAEVEKAYRKGVKKLNIPGFRVGKAPRSVIEKMYGSDFFYDEAVNSVYSDALTDAIDESGLEFIRDEIGFDIVSVGKEGLVFTAQITVKPEIEIVKYKGLEAEQKNVLVTESQVEEEIERVRKRNGRTISVEGRKSKDGDTAVFDFEGFVDGVPFDGGKADAFSLVLGSGQFIPGFEEQMIDREIGDEFDVNVTFPSDYGAENLASQEAVFKIKLHELKETELPELDDEFAKDVSEFDTLEEYKADILNKIKESSEKEASDFYLANIQTALIDNIDGEIPEAMFLNRVDDMLREFDFSLKQKGLDLNTYLKYTNMPIEQFRNSYLQKATRQVKLRLALEKIAELENIQVSEEEIEEEFAKLSEIHKMGVEEVKKAIDAKQLSDEMAMEKAMKIVEDSAVAKAAE